jgi:hypothetical protein
VTSPYREPAEAVEVTLSARDVTVIRTALDTALGNTPLFQGPFGNRDFAEVMAIIDNMLKRIKVVVRET